MYIIQYFTNCNFTLKNVILTIKNKYFLLSTITAVKVFSELVSHELICYNDNQTKLT